jgi:hypothetical protein
MRALVLSAALLAVLAACSGRPPEPKAPPATSTTSPNGEPLPFRAGADDCRGALAAWFIRADRNGDGVLDLGEMQADGQRWFATADLDGDGFITASELAEVRRRILPEPEPDPESEHLAPANAPSSGRRGPMLPRSQARVDVVMQADANADFRVSAQEYRNFVAAQFAAAAHGGALSQAQVTESCVKPSR